MELFSRACKNCGGDLVELADGQFKCRYCGTVFTCETVEKHVEELRRLFDEAKREAVSNARKNLYDAVNAEYISSTLVHECAMTLKQLLPDDFQANFYELAIGNNGRKIAKAIRKINVKENADCIETMIRFLISSLQSEYILEVGDLIDRAYKGTSLVKYEKYSTDLSKEAENLDNCLYMTSYPRDVFVAYSSKDMDKVFELVECLEDQGFSCFVAARNLRHGKGAVENYDKALREAMDSCQTFVFVSSMNSRHPGCDALTKEIPYIRSVDIENAPPEYKKDYIRIPHRYKTHRVEYRIEESSRTLAADRIVNEFFDGYERVYSPDEVAERLMQLAMGVDDTEIEDKLSEPTTASTKFCITCLNECPIDAKFCMNCGSSSFANTPNEAKLMQQIAEMQNAEKTRLQREQEEKERREAAERARREQEDRERREREAAERARREEELARREQELAERARREEELARREQELAERARREEELAHREQELAERAKLEQEEKERRERELAERARREQEEKERREREAAELAKREAEERERREREAAELAKREAEEKAKREAEEKARREQEERERREIEAAFTPVPNTVKIGDIIKYGRYEQTGSGKTPIEWIVLDKKDGRALVISKYGLDCKKFNNKSTTISWKLCTLRKWLNEDFINSAFIDAEKAHIPTVTVSAERNSAYGTDPSHSTDDRIFLLSISEAKRYFVSDEARACKPTEHTIANGALVDNSNGGCVWWLRTPGANKILFSCVAANGRVSDYGTTLDTKSIAVRPALWIKLEDATVEESKPQATPAVAPGVLPLTVKVGDVVKLGKYVQDGNSGGEIKPIEWLILDKKDDKALLISKYGLDCQKFNDEKANVTWETSSLRKWLNSTFLNSAFYETEMAGIKITSVTADRNPSCDTYQGNTTQDKIFVLSRAEVYKYFNLDTDRKCLPTSYAVSKGSYVHNSNGNCCFWWLRTSGGERNRALSVTCGGDVGNYGGPVDQDNVSVRPAVWVSLSTQVLVVPESEKREAEEIARREAEEIARRELEAAERAKREAEEKERREREAAERAIREAEEKERREREAAERARRERESRKTDQPVRIGEVVKFGKYKKTTKLIGGKTDIEWIVLDVQNGRTLLISKYGIDCQRYHDSGIGITWERCSLRKWLNNDFLSSAFSKPEMAKIQTTKVSADRNPSYSTQPGKPTQDKVFLLSIPEVRKYFANDAAMLCEATEYSIYRGVRKDPYGSACWWWLRTPGSRGDFVSYVCQGGIIVDGNPANYNDMAIRPAMWVDLRP